MIDEDATDISAGLEWKETHLIPFIVKEWGDAALNTLLNHVYFHTPPMRRAKSRGDILSFDSIREVDPEPPRVEAKGIPDVQKLKSHLEKFIEKKRSRTQRFVLSPRKDSVYIAGLKRLRAAENSHLQGEVEIREEDFPPFAPQK